MGEKIVYEMRNDKEETGIRVLRGTVTEKRGILSGELPCHPIRREQVRLIALCRGISTGGEQQSGTMSSCLIEEFLNRLSGWFEHELPRILPYFSWEIVKCYWRREIWELCGFRPAPFDFSVFFFYGDDYMYCGSGGIHIYEYLFSRRTYKRWYTASERSRFAGEIGRLEEPGIFFQCRRGREHGFFLLCPEEFQPGDPGKYLRKRKWQRFLSEQCRSSASVLLVER